MKDKIIIIGASHQDVLQMQLARRLEKAAAKLSTSTLIITPEKIKKAARESTMSLDDILTLIENFQPPTSPKEDLEKLLLSAKHIEFGRMDMDDVRLSLIDTDNRPWYEKAANPGGKKRKQRYNNKQRW